MSQADPGNTSKVAGPEAVKFFKRSKVDVNILKEIWRIAAQNSSEYLTKDDFYIALRLISYAQNGIAVCENSIRMNIESPLPKFETDGAAAFATGMAPPQDEPIMQAPNLAD